MAEAPTEGPDGGFVRLLGVEHVEAPEGEARGRLEVGEHLLQPYGIVHGGVHASLAETITSYATAMAVFEEGRVAIGQSNYTTFLRPVTEGHLNAHAVARHRGRTTWIWDVEITDDSGRACALVRMTIAVREPR